MVSCAACWSCLCPSTREPRSKKLMRCLASSIPTSVAGPIYIEYVMSHIDSVRALLANMQAKIDAELGLDQSDRFYSAILTCAFVGGLLSRRLGLHEIEISHVYQYALTSVTQVRAATKADIGDPTTVAQETLAAFINENVNNALVAPFSPPGGLPERQQLRRRARCVCATTLRLVSWPFRWQNSAGSTQSDKWT